MSTRAPASSRKKKRTRDKDEGDADADEQQPPPEEETLVASAPPSRRSGRQAKQPRGPSSAAAAAATKSQRKRVAKKPKLKHDPKDDKEDEDMGDAEQQPDDQVMDDAEEADQETPSQKPAAAEATTAATTTTGRSVPTTTTAAPRLQLPSEKTPGRPVARTKKGRAAAGRTTTTTTHRRVDLPKDDATDEVLLLSQRRANVTKTPHGKQKAAAKTAAAPRDEADEEPKAPEAPPLQRVQLPWTDRQVEIPPWLQQHLTWLQQHVQPVLDKVLPWLDHSFSQPWFVFLILGLLMTLTTFIVHPFLDSATSVARFLLLPTYRYILGFGTVTTIVPSPQMILSAATQELMEKSGKLNRTVMERQDEYTVLMGELVEMQRRLKEQYEAMEQHVETLEVTKSHVQSSLDVAAATWQGLADELQDISSLSAEVLVPTEDVNLRHFEILLNSLGESERGALLLTSNLSLWSPTLETCNIPSLDGLMGGDSEDAKVPKAITKEVVMESWKALEKELDSELQDLRKNKELRHDMERWINDLADSLPLPEYEEPDVESLHQYTAAAAASNAGKYGPTPAEVRQLVEDRLEIDRADGMADKDFAALFHGAAVVKSGPYATSPSLADRLPLFNRLMALMGTQFYGYGPEAALTPSYPSGALGQCWTFVQEQPTNQLGSFAVLTVKLAEPVSVESVTIEHSAAASQSVSKSAIRDFRLFGFMDEEAATDPIPLGSFTFEMTSKGTTRKEFDVDTDEDIPMLTSISLVVDSVWGSDYACLYRFRVHGSD